MKLVERLTDIIEQMSNTLAQIIKLRDENMATKPPISTSTAVEVTATFDATKDTNNLFDALDKINARTGRGTICLDDSKAAFLFDGTVAGTRNGSGGASKQFKAGSSQIWIYGRHPQTRVETINSFSFGFGVDQSLTSGTTTMPSVSAGVSKLDDATMAAALSEGDWIAMIADDSLPELLSHSVLGGGSGENRPAEQHKIQKINGNVISFDSPIVDAYTTTPRYKVLTHVENCGIANLHITRNVSATDAPFSISAHYCENFQIDNVTVKEAGTIWIVGCVDSSIRNVKINEQFPTKNADNYGLLMAGLINGLQVDNVKSWECRHACTTSSAFASGDHRYGTPLNIEVSNWFASYANKGNTPDDGESGAAVFDTHAEGYGVTFRNCFVAQGYSPTNLSEGFAFHVRARNTRVINCGMYSGTPDSRFAFMRTYAPDTHVINCYTDGGLQGIVAESINATHPSRRLHVNGFFAKNCRSNPINLKSTIGATIRNFDASGGGNGGTSANVGLATELSKCLIQMINPRSTAMTPIAIENCNLDKGTNNADFAIRIISGPDTTQLRCKGNMMHGWAKIPASPEATENWLGWDNTITGQDAFQDAYAQDNYSNPPHHDPADASGTYRSYPVYATTAAARGDADLPVSAQFYVDDGNAMTLHVKN